MKICCKPEFVSGFQAEIFNNEGETIEFEARYSHCYRNTFLGPDLVLAIFSFLALV
jgi:hypothetical protein